MKSAAFGWQAYKMPASRDFERNPSQGELHDLEVRLRSAGAMAEHWKTIILDELEVPHDQRQTAGAIWLLFRFLDDSGPHIEKSLLACLKVRPENPSKLVAEGITVGEILKELRREHAVRRQVYKKQVQEDRLLQHEAERQALLSAAIDLLAAMPIEDGLFAGVGQ